MFDTQKKEELRQRLQQLPEHIRDFVLSEELADTFFNIREKYQLHVDVAGKISEEVLLVLLGMTPPDEFVKKITPIESMAENVFNDLVKDIDKQIFQRLRRIVIQPPAQSVNTPLATATPASQPPQSPLASIQTKLENPSATPREVHDVSSTIDPYREPTK